MLGVDGDESKWTGTRVLGVEYAKLSFVMDGGEKTLEGGRVCKTIIAMDGD